MEVTSATPPATPGNPMDTTFTISLKFDLAVKEYIEDGIYYIESSELDIIGYGKDKQEAMDHFSSCLSNILNSSSEEE